MKTEKKKTKVAVQSWRESMAAMHQLLVEVPAICSLSVDLSMQQLSSTRTLRLITQDMVLVGQVNAIVVALNRVH